MKINLETIPQFILETAVSRFVEACERFPGLKVSQNRNLPVTVQSVPMHEVVDTTCNSPVEILEIPVLVEYSNLGDFDFSRVTPSVPGTVRVDEFGKAWLDADFSELGKQRAAYDGATA